MGSQNRRISGEVVKVIHDDSNEQVEHDEGAQEDEGYKVYVGDFRSTGLLWIYQLSSCVPFICSFITRSSRQTCQHDFRPGFSGGTSEN